MIDVIPMIVAALNTIGLDVLPENFMDANTPIPCITYIEMSNRDTDVGTTLEYSEIVPMIKVWSTDLQVLMSNAIIIDVKMKALGFKRDMGGTTFKDGMGQYILRYKGTGFDYKNKIIEEI